MVNAGSANAEKIVIIGASHAGVQLAVSLRAGGFAGSITLVSEESHTPYHRPPLSKAFLKDSNLQVQVLRAENYFGDNGIDLRRSVRVKNVEPANLKVELDSGEFLEYSKLCLATGARPRPLDVPGIKADGVYELRNCDDARILRDATRVHKKAIVVGGGFIGLEAAATLRQLGLEVCLVEATPRLMGRAVAPQISQFVLEKFQTHGVKVMLNTPISAIETSNGVVSGAMCGNKFVNADMALIGIGVVPNDELALGAGLTSGNGIEVNDHFQTSIENIYAIGDVANYNNWLAGRRIRLESVQNATDQARNLAASIMGKPEPYRVVPWFWSEQFDMKIQMVGLSNGSKTTIARQVPERGSMSVFHFDEGDKLVAIDTINAPADHMAGRKLIGLGLSPTRAQAKDANFRLKTLLN